MPKHLNDWDRAGYGVKNTSISVEPVQNITVVQDAAIVLSPVDPVPKDFSGPFTPVHQPYTREWQQRFSRQSLRLSTFQTAK
ncbi:hypothetical protein V865_000195 [Kwoniella europaea PYCC6329]|uniref:Uncharacterized protein n=1 Tax=Kwoniella europaea PYCC6329 TaxID=1423913 RepID=A0AAX4K6U1_9TREE